MEVDKSHRAEIQHKEKIEVNDADARHGALQSRPSEDSVTRAAVGGASTDELQKNYYRSPQFIASFLSMIITYQAVSCGYIMPANTLSIIDEELGPSLDIIWVLLAYVIVQSATYTTVGRLSDIFGRRWFFIGGHTLAMIGYLIAGSAKSINMLIAGTTVAGLGSGVQNAMLVIFGELVPNRHRHLALSISFVGMSPLNMLAPALARVFVQDATWRWCYYFVAILSGIAGALLFFFYHPPSFTDLHTRLTKRRAVMEIDYVGNAIWMAAVAVFVLGVSWGGQRYPWKSGPVIGTIVAGVCGFVAFGLYETFVPLKRPLMPLYLIKNSNYVIMMLVASVGSMVYYALNIVWPEQITAVYRKDSLTTGWMSCTLTIGACTGQLLGGFIRYYAKFVPLKWQLTASCITFTAFIGGMATVVYPNEGRDVAFSLIISIMIGFMELITLAGAPLMGEAGDIGIANGFAYTIRGTLSAVISSVYVTIQQNQLTTNYQKYIVPAVIKAGLPTSSVSSFLPAFVAGDSAAIQHIPGVTSAVLKAADANLEPALTHSYQMIYLVSISFGGAASILAMLLNGDKVAERMTPAIARKLQNVGKRDEKHPPEGA